MAFLSNAVHHSSTMKIVVASLVWDLLNKTYNIYQLCNYRLEAPFTPITPMKVVLIKIYKLYN